MILPSPDRMSDWHDKTTCLTRQGGTPRFSLAGDGDVPSVRLLKNCWMDRARPAILFVGNDGGPDRGGDGHGNSSERVRGRGRSSARGPCLAAAGAGPDRRRLAVEAVVPPGG